MLGTRQSPRHQYYSSGRLIMHRRLPRPFSPVAFISNCWPPYDTVVQPPYPQSCQTWIPWIPRTAQPSSASFLALCKPHFGVCSPLLIALCGSLYGITLLQTWAFPIFLNWIVLSFWQFLLLQVNINLVEIYAWYLMSGTKKISKRFAVNEINCKANLPLLAASWFIRLPGVSAVGVRYSSIDSLHNRNVLVSIRQSFSRWPVHWVP
jgi:hypothetical protein